MDFIKKIGSIVLALIIFTSFFTPCEAEAGTSGYSIPHATKHLMGRQCSVDLDGNGTKEKVRVKCLSQEDNGTAVLGIYINGKCAKKVDIMGYEGEWYKSYYYITNIDTSDTQREIAVIDMGPSDDAITCFYGYKNSRIVDYGYVEGFIYLENKDGSPAYDDYTVLNGDGTMLADTRLDTQLYITKYEKITWEFKDGKIALQPVKTYYDFRDAEEKRLEDAIEDDSADSYCMKLKMKFAFYLKKSKKSGTVTVKTSSKKYLLIIGTDNNHWLRVEYTSGNSDTAPVIGFIYANNGQIYNPLKGKYLEAESLISNLPYAD